MHTAPNKLKMAVVTDHQECDSFARMALTFFRMPFSIIVLSEGGEQHVISEIGIEDFQIKYLLHNDPADKEVFEAPDLQELPYFTNSFIEDHKIRYYNEIPLIDFNHRIGTLCLMDVIPRKLGAYEKEALKILAHQICEAIKLKAYNKELIEQTTILNQFLSGPSEAVAVINAQTLLFEKISQEFINLIGFELCHTNNTSFLDILHPNDKEKVANILSGAGLEDIVEFEASIICKDSKEKFLRWKLKCEENNVYLYGKDTTERRKTKSIQLEKEERHRRLSEFSFESIAIHEKGKIIDCNPTFVKTFGYDAEEVIGMNLFHFLPRVYREIVKNDVSNTDLRFDTLGVRKDSSTFPSEVMVKTIEHDGQVIHAVAIRDNTERKKLENELLKSTGFQRAILDSSSFAIISTDFSGLIKTFNKSAEKMLGLKSGEVVEKDNIVAFHLEEEIQEKAKQNSSESDSAINTGFEVLVENLKTLNVEESEWTYVRHDKTKLTVSVTITTLKDHLGEITGYLFMVTDISDRKKAEAEIIDKSQLLNGIVSNMPVFVFKVNPEGIFTQTIGAGLHNLDLDQNKLVNTNIFDAFPEVADHIDKAYRGEYVSFINSTVIPDKELYYEYFIFPDIAIKDGLIGFALDITDKINAEQKLKESATHLSKINKELDQFAYVVSHDLKAPLRAIANLSEWIEEDLGTELEEDVKNNMNLLRGRVQRMQNLIDGILNYSRVGRIKSTYEKTNVNSLVKEVINIVSVPDAFTVDIPKQLPTIYTNNIWLEQIFSNLISNAIKYHDQPSGKIIIDFEDKNKLYQFSVADDGPGIPKEYHEKVFIIFQTLQARDKKENTGVGLAIVKKIVEEQGGTIWIESEGRGSKFIFTLPKCAGNNN